MWHQAVCAWRCEQREGVPSQVRRLCWKKAAGLELPGHGPGRSAPGSAGTLRGDAAGTGGVCAAPRPRSLAAVTVRAARLCQRQSLPADVLFTFSFLEQLSVLVPALSLAEVGFAGTKRALKHPSALKGTLCARGGTLPFVASFLLRSAKLS